MRQAKESDLLNECNNFIPKINKKSKLIDNRKKSQGKRNNNYPLKPMKASYFPYADEFEVGNENLSADSNDFYGNSISKKDQPDDRFNALYEGAKQ